MDARFGSSCVSDCCGYDEYDCDAEFLFVRHVVNMMTTATAIVITVAASVFQVQR